MKQTLKSAVAMGALMAYLKPRLAADAQIDLNPIVDGLTNKNFAERKPGMIAALQAATKDKLAKDAHINDVTGLLDALESHKAEEHEEGEEKKFGKDQEAMKAAQTTGGTESSESRRFLQGKLSAEDMASYDKMCADEEAKQKAEDEAKKEEEETKSKEALKAMDESITKTVNERVAVAVAAERARNEAIRAAEKNLRPYIGEANLAMDSAEGMYRQGLKMLGVKTKLDDLTLPALEAILEAQPKPGAQRQQQTNSVAFDAKAAEGVKDRFPSAHKHIPRQL